MKEGLEDFIKFAYEKGDIKDISEAFKELPPEEEWHKGEIENILKEDYDEYIKSYIRIKENKHEKNKGA